MQYLIRLEFVTDVDVGSIGFTLENGFVREFIGGLLKAVDAEEPARYAFVEWDEEIGVQCFERLENIWKEA